MNGVPGDRQFISKGQVGQDRWRSRCGGDHLEPGTEMLESWGPFGPTRWRKFVPRR